jgi:uncharacterized membrane protein YraQ (UPF0718 family)/copper chaperone CopZ
MTVLTELLAAAWDVMLELAPWLLLGALVSALLHKWLPPDFLERNLSGRWGVLKAVLFGVPLPLCSCGVIPAGLGLKKDGASDAASIGFMISTPQTGVDSVLVAASFLGWPFALFKVGAAAATGLVGGTLTGLLGEDHVIEGAHEHAAAARTWRGALDHGLQLVQTIWGWLLFGVFASAAITVWVPQEWLGALSAGGGLLGMLAVLVVAVPLYVCATASVPIAAALVAGGMPAGAALVFLMAGPATNVATLGAIYRGFGLRTTGIYLGTILVGSVALGWGFDWVLTSTGTLAPHVHGAAWWATGSAVALTGMIAWFAFIDLRRWWLSRQAPTKTQQTLPVTGMTCKGCAARLERVLGATEGVESAVVSYPDGTAVVDGLVDRALLVEAVEGAGFGVEP